MFIMKISILSIYEQQSHTFSFSIIIIFSISALLCENNAFLLLHLFTTSLFAFSHKPLVAQALFYEDVLLLSMPNVYDHHADG